MSLERDVVELKKLFEDAPIFKPASSKQILNRPKPSNPYITMSEQEIEDEFYTCSIDVDTNFLISMIPIDAKRDFVVQYHAEDYLDQ